MNIKDPNTFKEICDEIDVDLSHNELPDPEREMIEVALRQIQRLEEKVHELEKELAATKAEISDEARRTSALEIIVESPKVDLTKKEKLK